MSAKAFPIRNKATARTRELKEAILASFGSHTKQSLNGFTDADWQSVLWWLDISGTAIYFLDRISQNGSDSPVPSRIVNALVQRWERNRIRIDSLRQEASILAGWFSAGHIPYALLKGITLAPDSVPDSALRCQTDLDFLISRRSAEHAMHYLRRLGYRLRAKSGDTLEFRAGEAGLPDTAKMYSVDAQRALELHLVSGESPLLRRRVSREFDGNVIDALSPADILVQQALHLLKHLCGEHTRLSWVLEFWRNVHARSADIEFWQQVEFVASQEANGDLAMGVALWTAEALFGKLNHPEMMQQWGHKALPPRVHLWLERYLRDILLSDSTGSKLYALLRAEVPQKPDDTRTTRAILFPHYLPVRLTEAKHLEHFADRIGRYRVEANFFFRRFKFHVVEGVRLCVETSRWKRATLRCGQ